METVMDSVGLYWQLSTSIDGLLKPINPNGICPKTQYRKAFLYVFLMVKSWWYVMAFVI